MDGITLGGLEEDGRHGEFGEPPIWWTSVTLTPVAEASLRHRKVMRLVALPSWPAAEMLVNACASQRNPATLEENMRIRFVGIDPDTGGNNCPAVFVDEDTGDIWFQGDAVTDPAALAEVGKHSPLGETEAVVKLPPRMASIIREAIGGDGHE